MLHSSTIKNWNAAERNITKYLVSIPGRGKLELSLHISVSLNQKWWGTNSFGFHFIWKSKGKKI